jgi:RNA polymerase sigma-70 factor (sigma-E family)
VDDLAVRSDFEAFARENWSTLMSIGVAVGGSRAEAEDLVQTALTNAYTHWRRIRRDQALAYLRRSILNANVSRWRRHGRSEFSVAELPDARPGDHASTRSNQSVEDRQTLLPLLRDLPARQRAVLVLRYLCDLPDDEVAETLNVSPSTVRSQAFRGLAALRVAAADHARLDQNREGVPR